MFSIAADVRNTLGECPLWCERTCRLYWTDIECSELLALEEGDDAVMRWSLPERLGSCLLYTSPSPRDATLSRMPSSA